MFESGVEAASAVGAPAGLTGLTGPVPGPEAAVWLAGVDPRVASAADRFAALELVGRQASWLASIEAGLLASFQADADAAAAAHPAGKEWVGDEVGAVLRLRGDFARNRMAVATQLVRRLPATLGLLSGGVISPVQARDLAEAVTGRCDEVCSAVEARVLLRAPDQSSTQFRATLKRALIAADPDTADQHHDDARRYRRVIVVALDDGMAGLWAELPAPDAMRLKAAIWRLAHTRKTEADQRIKTRAAEQPAAKDQAANDQAADDQAAQASGLAAGGRVAASTAGGEGDGEGEGGGEGGEGPGCSADESPTPSGVAPIDAYRADALLELADRYLTESDPTGAINRAAPTIMVRVDLLTLTGDTTEPADLNGYGAIPPGLARHLAADPTSTWRRLVTDPTGEPINLGATRYRPPKSLADFVRTKHHTCIWPTCNRPAETCDLDHTIAWPKGHTCADNLAPMCSQHHHLKHESGWSITRDPTTGIVEWTSPTGRKYINPRPD